MSGVSSQKIQELSSLSQKVAPLFSHILPLDRIRTGADDLIKYGRDWRTELTPNPSLILFPVSIIEVQEIVRKCITENLGIVPSGGRTGLSGGATATKGEVVLSFEKFNKKAILSKIDRTLTLDPGVTTERAINVAKEAGLHLPLDFAAKGSAQIGGNIATNVGGIKVIKWGNIRRWVLGLTIVTGTGEIVRLNGALYKNQTGYDLRNLIIGSEGTLGLIVEAILTLTTPPGPEERVLCAIADYQDIPRLLERCRDIFPSLSLFEFFDSFCLDVVTESHGISSPFPEKYPGYVLLDIETNTSSGVTCTSTTLSGIEEGLSQLLEEGIICDVVIAQGSKQKQELLNYRERISETLSSGYSIHKNDISVPLSTLSEFIQKLPRVLSQVDSRLEVGIFGHFGDGNLHVNYVKSSSMKDVDFVESCKSADEAVYSLIQSLGGSISAEHGVGLLKLPYLSYTQSKIESALMADIKRTFDPHGILNPGKMIPSSLF